MWEAFVRPRPEPEVIEFFARELIRMVEDLKANSVAP